MKKRLLLIALASTMLLAACNKNKNESQGEAVFTATTEHQGGRTSLDPNNGNINWTAGDRIVIANDNDETAIFSLRSGEGTTEGGFSTADDFNTVGPFVAAYPEAATIANEVVTFNLPATQAMGETGTFANGSNPMVACSDDKNLQFKNLCGGLGIRLKGVGAHVSAVRITSKNITEKLWGAFEVSNCAANEPTLTEASGNQGTNVVTLTCDVTLTTAAKTFFVMLPPGTLANGFTMEVLDGDEVLSTKETDSDVALVERNNVKVFNEILIDVEFDGNVEIPTGMTGADIIVTNLDEDAIPDENGDFAIGYSKMLVAKNSDNGNIMYFGLYSIDPRNRSDKTGSDDYELNAKETALYLSLKLLPFYMQDGSDEVMNKMKESIYALPCVQSLESAIQNVVNTFGYLKTDEITNAVDAVGTFFYNEFSSLEQKGGISEPKSVKHENLESPYFNPSHRHGVRLNINESQFNAETQKWTINCTGYSSQFVALGLVPGYLDENTNDFSWNQQTANPYFLPPMSTSKYVELAENVGFLSSPGNWAGMLQLYRAMRESIQDPEYLLPYVTSHVDDMVFDIPRTINAIGVLSPKDAYVNGMLDLLNVVYIVVDGLSVVLPEYIPLDAVVNAYMSDGEFCQLFYNEHENGREGWALIFDSFKSKLPNVVLSIVPSTPQMVINHIINELVPIDAITFFMDASIMAVTVNLLNSFELPVVADFPVSELPTVAITSVSAVSDDYAHVEARIVDEGSHSISSKGVCYSTSPEPDLDDNVVEGTYYGYGNNQFSCDLENLEPNTTYYVRAYAQNWLQLIAYSEEVSFTTVDVPTVTTLEVTNITNSTAVANASVTFSNMSQIVERGFLYGTSDEGLWYGNVGSDVAVYEGTSQNDFSCSLAGLDSNTEYYVRAYAKTVEGIGYGDIVSFTTSGGGGTDDHAYVDLGLPSGLLWATCNVGADNPEDYGDYFAWGETQPRDMYNWSTYQYCNGSYTTLTKYCNSSTYGNNGFTDNLTTLLPEDDAATANWGSGWRMPTQAEFQELLDNTTVTWTQQNGVNGRLFTAANGNSLFLPAVGYRYDGSLDGAGSFGLYWSSSLSASYPCSAWFLDFYSGNYLMRISYRYRGQSVRPVRSSGQK